MTKSLLKSLLVISVLTLSFSAKAQTLSASFNWNQPSTLTPAYSAPNSDNRYGEYISLVEFKDNGVTFVIDDSAVKEQSRRARFLFNYLTQACEMRAYVDSYITITAPESYVITSIEFSGPKVGSDYLSAVDETLGTVGESNWTAADGAQTNKVILSVDATINCTLTTVNCATQASVSDIALDTADTVTTWTDLSGRVYTSRPTVPGLYIARAAGTATKLLIK